ncbi:hypothetical protein EV177_008687, partial [Coemansia sp. RSA 1804]
METKGKAENGAYPQFDTASPSAGAGGGQPSFHDYLKANNNHNYQQHQLQQQQQQAGLASFLMHGGNASASKSTPGSPATFAGGLGFNSVCASPVLGPSLPQSPQAVAAFLGANNSNFHHHHQQQHLQHYAYDSTANSAVQSATGSPTTGAAHSSRHGLLNSMAGLNMTQLPPPAAATSTMSTDNASSGFSAASSGIANTQQQQQQQQQ